MRVIAGKYKSLKLNSFESDEIRPTTDKVKEAVFSKIQFQLRNAKFLDLFGGTGAIGIEAISRGADVYVCDKSSKSCAIIKDNYKRINIEPKLINCDYIRAIDRFQNLGIRFDICYLDPPYHTSFGVDAINRIVDGNILNINGLIIYEHLRELPYSASDKVEVVTKKDYGTISVEYLKVRNDV